METAWAATPAADQLPMTSRGLSASGPTTARVAPLRSGSTAFSFFSSTRLSRAT